MEEQALEAELAREGADAGRAGESGRREFVAEGFADRFDDVLEEGAEVGEDAFE